MPTHPMLERSPYLILGAKLQKWQYVQEGDDMVLTLTFDNGNSLVFQNPEYDFNP